MKYIVIEVTGNVELQVPFVFPEMLVHAMVAAQMEALLRIQYPGCKASTVSAGSINVTAQSTYGKSVSLDLNSRVSDGQLINGADYGACQGIDRGPVDANDPFAKLNAALTKMHQMLDQAGIPKAE